MKYRSKLLLVVAVLAICSVTYAANRTYTVSCLGALAPSAANTNSITVTYFPKAPDDSGNSPPMTTYTPEIKNWQFTINLPDSIPDTAVLYVDIDYKTQDPNSLITCIGSYLPVNSTVLNLNYTNTDQGYAPSPNHDL